MLKNLIYLLLCIFVVTSLLSGCGDSSEPGNNLADSFGPQVQKAWLEANKQKLEEILRPRGFDPQKTGKSRIEIAEYRREGDGVNVIFIEGINDPPRIISIAYLLPLRDDGLNWRIAGYIATVDSGEGLKTIVFEKAVGEPDPFLGVELDSYLDRNGLEREKIEGENLLIVF